MPKYRVIRGSHRREDGSVADRGDVVEMAEDVRDSFAREKFQRIETDDEADSEALTDAPDTADEAVEESVDDPTASDVTDEPDTDEPDYVGDVAEAIPYDNYRLLSRMAADADSEDVHGAMSGDAITEHLETLTYEQVVALREQAEAETTEP